MTVPDTASRTDAELLTAHAAGDRSAFAHLYARHGANLARLAAARCRTPEDAADALQEAMLAAHRGAADFQHRAKVTTWLYRIVTNACLELHRHNARRLQPVSCGLGADVVHPSADHAEQVDTALVVWAALRALPAEQRAAVIVVDMQGHSIAEAARVLGVAEGTVKSRRARARVSLLAALRPPAGSGPDGARH